MKNRIVRANVTSRIFRPGQLPPPDDEWLERPIEERIAGVWELTKLCHAWSEGVANEPRLQRSISRIQRLRG